jgi:APA family basic amino acid/polyamine antiporter
VDPYTPRPYKVPLNISLRTRRGEVHFPVLGAVGLLAISSVLMAVLYTHSVARIAGPVWVLFCFLYYVWYRHRRKLPILHSVPRDWEKIQTEVLTSAEEYDLLEQYSTALMVRDRARLREKNSSANSRHL